VNNSVGFAWNSVQSLFFIKEFAVKLEVLVVIVKKAKMPILFNI